MNFLDALMSWANRVAVLASVLMITLMIVCKEGDIPMSRAALSVGHLLSFSVWFGTSVWVSFIAGVVLLSAVDIEAFGSAQAKLFDAYFRFSLLCLAGAGFTGAALGAQDGARVMGAGRFVVALACVVANLLFFSPQTTITMFERRRVCKELGVDRKSKHPQVRKLSKRFGMFHGLCVVLNMVALGCGCVHLGKLAGSLNL